MLHDEERERDADWEYWLHENPMNVGRGIVWGVTLGALLWGCIIGGVWYFFIR